MMSGFGWAPERELPIDAVTQKRPECYESQQVRIWCGLIQWSLQPKSVVIYDPDYIQVLTGTVFGGVEPERLKELQASFEAAFHRYERHIFPIRSWKNESVEHWTLLVLEATAKKIRYYETLEHIKEANFEMAETILKIVGFEAKVTRVSKLRQVEVECGEALCHYTELDVREATKEGWGQFKDSLRSAAGR